MSQKRRAIDFDMELLKVKVDQMEKRMDLMEKSMSFLERTHRAEIAQLMASRNQQDSSDESLSDTSSDSRDDTDSLQREVLLAKRPNSHEGLMRRVM
jgi:hypothetical protein